MLKYFFLFLIAVCATQAFLKEEVDALERELADAHEKKDFKKSTLNDMSTNELIEELKREVDSMTHHDKFRPKFDDIFEKKEVKEKTWPRELDMLNDDFWDKTKAMEDSAECKDTRSDCNVLKSYCITHKEKLKDSCAKTCNLCNGCIDTYGSCANIKTQCFGVHEVRMAKMCTKTCGICKAPAPPKCSKTKFGCCWNKETTKENAQGDNCPACRNEYKYVCKTFKDDCPGLTDAGKFMRRHCPAMCGLCSGECKDHPDKVHLCPLWKTQLRWCDERKDIMRHYCPETCQFC